MVKITERMIERGQRLRDIYDTGNQVKDILQPIPPQEGLIPLQGTPFYVTPDVIDPSDCEHWSGSPLCGGNPFDGNPFSGRGAIGVGIDVVADECSIGVQISPSILFRLPERQIILRNPNCRPVPPPTGTPDGGTNFSEPFNFPLISENTLINIAFSEDYEYNRNFIPIEGETQTYRQTHKINLIEVRCQPNMFGLAHINSVSTYDDNVITQEDEFFPDSSFANGGSASYWIFDENGTYIGSLSYVSEDNGSPSLFKAIIGEFKLVKGMCIGVYTQKPISPNLANRIAQGSFKNPIWKSDSLLITEIRDDGFLRETFKNKRTYIINELDGCAKHKPPQLENPNPPPPKKCPPCMSCCHNSDDDSNALLQIVLQRIGLPTSAVIFDSDENRQDAQAQTRQIPTLFSGLKLEVERTEKTSKMIGIDAFPIEVPDSVIKPEKTGIWAEIGKLFKWEQKRKIRSVAELLVWLAEQDSAVNGQFHQVIEIQDADSTKAGNQPKKVVLPNIAETLKEIIVLLIELTKTSELNLDVTLKTLTETSGTKLETVKAQRIVEDIQQYLDYPTVQKTLDVPVQITLPSNPNDTASGNDLYKFLTPSRRPIIFDDWTGDRSLEDTLLDILQVVAMMRADKFNRTQ